MLWMLLVSLVTAVLPMPQEPAAAPGGVNKATFDKIKRGMTARELETLTGRKTNSIWGGFDSEIELWEDKQIRIWVEYEPTVADGKVTSASFQDFSTGARLTF